jgi:hypothetical protein
VLHTVRPETADQTLARQVEAEEVEARGKTKLSFRPHGDGTTRISAVVPDATAARLKTYLDAFTSPRQGARRGEGPYPRILGAALCALLERLDPEALPRHGGRATTLIVTMSLAGLRQDLATGQVLGGESFAGGCSGGAISATEVRRLACTAGLVPAVLGGQGEVLDLGRERRLFSPAQVKALIVNQRTCRAEGCDMPAAWCEAHHWDPWSQGGRTDLNDGVMLCAHHHHRVHDPRYESQRNPGGTITITRRRT